MKILKLDLKAFGPFTDHPIDLSEGKEGMHVIYGPNEAGKSSTLRALHAFFYGIPRETEDQFVHKYDDLRIGVRIRHSDGTEQSFLRRKGNKNTLLDLEGKALPDTALQKFIGGVDAGLFSSFFGLNHAALVEGGNDILLGKGEVGQSLFSAGLGVANLNNILKNLKDEADALYSPRAFTKPLNQALNDYKEANKERQHLSLSSKEWEEHEASLRETEAERDRVMRALEEADRTRAKQERVRKALPPIATLKKLTAEILPLSSVVFLRPTFSENRRSVRISLDSAQATKKLYLERLDHLKREIEVLSIPEELLLQEEMIKQIHQRLGSHLKAVEDRKNRQSEKDFSEADAEKRFREMDPRISFSEVETLRLPVQKRTGIRELGKRVQSLDEEQQRGRKQIEELETKQRSLTKRLEGVPAERDGTDLRLRIRQAQNLGSIEAACAALDATLKKEEEQARIQLQTLGLWSGGLDSLEALAIPSSETMDRFEEDFGIFKKKQQRTEEQAIKAADRLEKVEGILRLERMEDVPSERELKEARKQRDAEWNRIRSAWFSDQRHSGSPPDLDAYEGYVRESDDCVDRLRREADRVAEKANAETERDKYQADIARLTAEKNSWVNEEGKLQTEWLQLWQPLLIVPLTPREMRTWLQRHEKLAQQIRNVRGLRTDLEQRKNSVVQHRDMLIACLIRLGELQATSNDSLEALITNGQAVSGKIDKTTQERAGLKESLDDVEARKEKGHRDFQGIEATFLVAQREWATNVQSLQLDEHATPTQAEAMLDTLQEIFKCLDTAGDRRRRIEAIDRDADLFESDVKDLITRLAPDLLNLPIPKAVMGLDARVSACKVDKEKREGLLQRKREFERTLEKALEEIQQGEQQMAQLCKEAGCLEAELGAAERQSANKGGLLDKKGRTEAQLLALGDGLSLEALMEEADATDADALPIQMERLATKIQDLKTEQGRLTEKIGEEKEALKNMRGKAEAGDAAERSESLIAEIRDGANRYIRLKLAAALLYEAIERYRVENQDPLLHRASALFAIVTLGSLSRIESDFNKNDQPVLVGIRPSGEKVMVEGMSEGTRDQLYLALRLASVERHLSGNEPMPLILDDILINFDDERAQAILGVLADLSTKTQVILFTHHARIRDAAREGFRSQTVVHEL